MKPIALDSKPEEPLTHDSRARAGRLNSATPIPVSCLTFTHRISSEHLNESVGAITCTTPNCAGGDQCNQQYSIYALTDSSGNVSERYAYTAYGQPTFLNASATVQTNSAAANRYTYTGREWDQTIGLSHFRARWISGVCGRFLQRDPIGFRGRSLNLAQFVGSAPLIAVDPTGLEWRFPHWWSPYCYPWGHPPSVLPPIAEDEDIDELIDDVDDSLCSFFLVCEVVIPTPGEGVACAGVAKTTCKLVKVCRPKLKPKRKPPSRPRKPRGEDGGDDGRCYFNLAWCLWGNINGEQGWKKNAPCFECYDECKKTKGIWSIGKCPLGYHPPTWGGSNDGSVWPPGHWLD